MDTEEKKTPFKHRILGFVEDAFYIAFAVVLALIVQMFVIRPFIVSGSSMDPTFKNGDYLIVDEISYRIHPPSRGDVVVFKAPPEPTKYYIKRIIGLPGDTVHIEKGQVTITNSTDPKGFTLDQKFIEHTDTTNGTYIVPNGDYFVMGDNRSGSYDSRMWGFLPVANMRGRALLRLLPLKNISVLPGKVTDYEQPN